MNRTVFKVGVATLVTAAGLLVALAGVTLDGAVFVGAGAVCLIPVLVGFGRRQHDIFEPSYLFAVAFGILFVIRPILEWSSVRGVPIMQGLDPTPTYLAAVALAALGGVSFYAGYYSPAGMGLAARLPKAPEALDEGRVRIGVLAVALIGIALYAAFLITSGGLGSFAAVLAGRNTDFVSAVSQPVGYLYSGLLILFPAGVMLLVMARRWLSLTGLAGMALVSTSIITAVFTGSRSATLPAVMTLVLLWYLRRGSRPRLGTVVALALVGFILVISVPRDYRNTADRTGSLVDAVESSISNAEATGREFFLGLDTAMLPAFAVELAYVPDVIPYQLGSTYVEAALRPVPRAFWSAKPQAADTHLMEVLWPDLAAQRIGLSFSLFAEPFLNFGLPGVVVISFLFGVTWRALWEFWRRQPQNAVAVGIYAISWPFLFVYMRGGIGVDYQRQLIALAPFIALAWFGARRRDATDQANRRVGSRDRLGRRPWPQLPADVRASTQGASRGGGR